MLVIGVTGGVGTGKSTVSRMLAEFGAQIIDADQLVHELIVSGSPVHERLVEAFGTGVLRPDGEIDRRKLAVAAFAGAEQVRLINSIVHPPVIELIGQRLAELAAADEPPPAAVLDVPLLFESGLDMLCDEVWVVQVDLEVRLERLGRRNGAAATELISRERWQLPMAAKVDLADVVIDTSGPLEQTRGQVERAWLASRA